MKLLACRVKDLEIFEEKEKFPEAILIFVGIEKNDKNLNLEEIAKNFLEKEIIEKDGKFDVKIKDSHLPLVLVSQITLAASFSSQGRISFDLSPPKEEAKEIFERFYQALKNFYNQTFKMPFGSYLQLKFINIGPNNFVFSYD
jgi:D-tyrosyl-tRNA(Tyr) deacylase